MTKKKTVYSAVIPLHLGEELDRRGVVVEVQRDQVQVFDCAQGGVFLPEINEETWYQQVMCNKHP